MDGVKDEVVPSRKSEGCRAMTSAPQLITTSVHIALHQYVPVSVGHRRRVVIGLVPDQGQRTDPAGLLVAGVIGHGGQGKEGLPGPAPCAGRWSHRGP